MNLPKNHENCQTLLFDHQGFAVYRVIFVDKLHYFEGGMYCKYDRISINSKRTRRIVIFTTAAILLLVIIIVGYKGFWIHYNLSVGNYKNQLA
jgi:hypothetical protein